MSHYHKPCPGAQKDPQNSAALMEDRVGPLLWDQGRNLRTDCTLSKAFTFIFMFAGCIVTYFIATVAVTTDVKLSMAVAHASLPSTMLL